MKKLRRKLGSVSIGLRPADPWAGMDLSRARFQVTVFPYTRGERGN